MPVRRRGQDRRRAPVLAAPQARRERPASRATCTPSAASGCGVSAPEPGTDGVRRRLVLLVAATSRWCWSRSWCRWRCWCAPWPPTGRVLRRHGGGAGAGVRVVADADAAAAAVGRGRTADAPAPRRSRSSCPTARCSARRPPRTPAVELPRRGRASPPRRRRPGDRRRGARAGRAAPRSSAPFVADAELTAGVGRAWLVLALLGAGAARVACWSPTGWPARWSGRSPTLAACRTGSPTATSPPGPARRARRRCARSAPALNPLAGRITELLARGAGDGGRPVPPAAHPADRAAPRRRVAAATRPRTPPDRAAVDALERAVDHDHPRRPPAGPRRPWRPAATPRTWSPTGSRSGRSWPRTRTGRCTSTVPAGPLPVAAGRRRPGRLRWTP